MFPDMKRGITKKGSFLMFDNSNAVNLDMERMEVKKCHQFERNLEASRQSILLCFIKAILKQLIEKTRKLGVVGKFAFQQIQIDHFFLV